jgi:hypothetical protein
VADAELATRILALGVPVSGMTWYGGLDAD